MEENIITIISLKFLLNKQVRLYRGELLNITICTALNIGSNVVIFSHSTILVHYRAGY